VLGGTKPQNTDAQTSRGGCDDVIGFMLMADPDRARDGSSRPREPLGHAEVLRSSQIDQKRAAHRKLTEVSELLDRLCHLFAGRACTADLPPDIRRSDVSG
jgi:hypothetical protein